VFILTQTIYIECRAKRSIMLSHNLISHNQLEGWRDSFQKVNKSTSRAEEEQNQINDYYDCLIECDDNQSACKRICKHVLTSPPI